MMLPKRSFQRYFLFAYFALLVIVQVNCQDEPPAEEETAAAPDVAPAEESVRAIDETPAQESARAEDETPAEDGEAEEEGRSIFGSIKKRAEQLMDSINEAHAGDPKDVLELAKRTLEKAFNNFNGGKDEISVAHLLSVIELAGGEERLHTLRILELMDKDMDGEISREEFVQLYAAPMAFPDKALELMHRSFDLDDNGLISQWERLRYLLTLEGINQNIYDKYAQALQLGYAQDSNSDGLTSLTEFMLYMVWQINLGMEQVKSKGVKRPFPLPADGGVFNEPLPIDEASGVFPEPLPVEESQPVPEGDPPPTE